MNNFLKTLICCIAIPMAGCSTLSQTFWTRPVIEDVPGGFNTLSLTADRRIAIFRSDKNNMKNPKGLNVCAEALPDVAISSTVESGIKVALKAAEKGELSVEAAEKLTQALTVAYQRTEKSDLVRQLGWQVCQGHLNGAVSNEDYRRLLEMMVVASLVKAKSDGTSDLVTIQSFIKK